MHGKNPLPPCGGGRVAHPPLHLSPKRGERAPAVLSRANSRAGLTGAAHLVLEGCELLDADLAARVHAAGGDADLAAEAELAAVGELRRGVVQHDGGIDL